MTRQVIEQMQTAIEDLLQKHLDKYDHNAVMQRLLDISTYLGTGAACITHAKKLELEQRGAWLRKYREEIDKMKPSVAKEFVNTACVPEQVLSLRCDRNYSALTHAGDNLRSVLSTIKTEMQMNNAA